MLLAIEPETADSMILAIGTTDPIQREVYVTPPLGLGIRRGKYWRKSAKTVGISPGFEIEGSFSVPVASSTVQG